MKNNWEEEFDRLYVRAGSDVLLNSNHDGVGRTMARTMKSFISRIEQEARREALEECVEELYALAPDAVKLAEIMDDCGLEIYKENYHEALGIEIAARHLEAKLAHSDRIKDAPSKLSKE